MDAVLQKLDDIQQTQQHVLVRLDDLERSQTETNADRRALHAAVEDVSLEVQALRLPRLEPAVHRVMRTTELLEAVLLYVGTPVSSFGNNEVEALRDLLLAGRVSKQFKSVIDGSSKIQVALYFSPGNNRECVKLNPLLCGARFSNNLGLWYEKATCSALQLIHISKVKPGSHHLAFGHIRLMPGGWGNRESKNVHLALVERDQCRRKSAGTHGHPDSCDTSRRTKGSWERMMLSQPPLPIVWEIFSGEGRLVHRAEEVSGTDTLGTILQSRRGPPKPPVEVT